MAILQLRFWEVSEGDKDRAGNRPLRRPVQQFSAILFGPIRRNAPLAILLTGTAPPDAQILPGEIFGKFPAKCGSRAGFWEKISIPPYCFIFYNNNFLS